jgi:hypothetical protein
MPEPSVNAWILAPLHSAVLFVGEEAKLGGLLQRALIHVEKGRPLLELAEQRLLAAGKTDTVRAVRVLLQEAPLQEQWAAELRATDYATLNAHALVAICGALETCVEDVVVAILSQIPSAMVSIAKAGIRVDPNKLASPPTEDELRTLYRKIEDAVRVKYVDRDGFPESAFVDGNWVCLRVKKRSRSRHQLAQRVGPQS